MTVSAVDTIVRGGRVVTATDVLDASIAIKGETIVAVAGSDEVLPAADRYIDASGMYVFPGLIDCHVHLGPDNDDWRTGGLAAAHAGLTTLVVFGTYDDQAGESVPSAIRRLREEIESQCVVDCGLHFILNNQPSVLEGVPEAFQLGVTSYKLFMTYRKRPNRMCSDDFICRVMEAVAACGGVTQLHCENGYVLDHLENKALAENRTHPREFPATCPPWTEEEAINRAVKIGAMTGSPVYVVHLSTQLGLERIKQAQATGQAVWAETCPQYLLLSDEEMERWGPYAKIGPPLRSAQGPDRAALWAGSAQGYIATIASDHAAKARAAKEPGWGNVFVDSQGKPIPFGQPSIETLVPLSYGEGVAKRGLPLTWLARVLAENPARIFGLYPRKGAIRVGADADLLLLDPRQETTIRAADHHSMAGYTLYEGWRVPGRIHLTLLRGRVLLNDGGLQQKPGYGRYLRRTGPVPPLAGVVQ